MVGARGATGFVLPVGSEAFEESGRSLVRGTLDYLQGLKVRVLLIYYNNPQPQKGSFLPSQNRI